MSHIVQNLDCSGHVEARVRRQLFAGRNRPKTPIDFLDAELAERDRMFWSRFSRNLQLTRDRE